MFLELNFWFYASDWITNDFVELRGLLVNSDLGQSRWYRYVFYFRFICGLELLFSKCFFSRSVLDVRQTCFLCSCNIFVTLKSVCFSKRGTTKCRIKSNIVSSMGFKLLMCLFKFGVSLYHAASLNYLCYVASWSPSTLLLESI